MPTTTTAPLPAVGTYTLDPSGSSISGKTRAMFGLAGVSATFAFESGELVVADPPTASRATASVRAASFSSGTPKRDHHVASADFLDAENHPSITFSATAVVPAGDGWSVQGNLTVRGVTSSVELAVQSLESTGGAFTVTATTTVDRFDYGITRAKGMAGGKIALTVVARATRS
jgi:polyisoprenoid-binding protein YceI